MAVDLLEQGPERPPARPSRRRTAAVVLAAGGVVVAGALQVRVDPPAEPEASGRLLERAEVLSVRPAPAGGLHVRVGVVGPPRARLSSVEVELPGSAVVLLPAPDRLTDAGDGLLALDVLPRCPEAVPGLSRATVTARVGPPTGSPVRQERVALDTAGPLVGAVRSGCGLAPARPRLRTSVIGLDGPAGDPLRTVVEVSASDVGDVTVVGVRPGPGLAATVRTALPLRLSPGQAPVRVRVDLRPGECGRLPDTPPFVLVLSSGEAVPPRVAPGLVPLLDALRPRPCAG